MGLEGAKADVSNIVSSTGVNASEAAESVLEARDKRVSGTDVARLVGTGRFSAAEAAKALRQFGSPERALAASMRVSVTEAGQALAASTAVNQGGGTAKQQAQWENITSGRAAAASAEMDAEAMDPEGQAAEKMRRSVEATTRSMNAAAAAQMQCVADLKDLAKVLGFGEGSEATKRDNYKDVTRN
jgi:Tfp pilus assembly protein PilV